MVICAVLYLCYMVICPVLYLCYIVISLGQGAGSRSRAVHDDISHPDTSTIPSLKVWYGRVPGAVLSCFYPVMPFALMAKSMYKIVRDKLFRSNNWMNDCPGNSNHEPNTTPAPMFTLNTNPHRESFLHQTGQPHRIAHLGFLSGPVPVCGPVLPRGHQQRCHTAHLVCITQHPHSNPYPDLGPDLNPHPISCDTIQTEFLVLNPDPCQ